MIDKIIVGGVTYTIELVDGLTSLDHARKENGRTQYQSSRILIEDRLPETKKRQVMLHELLHAIINFIGMTNKEFEDEEDLVEKLSQSLLMVIRNNPELVEELTREE